MGARHRGARDEFPIPMRGNEIDTLTYYGGVARMVSDPHEG